MYSNNRSKRNMGTPGKYPYASPAPRLSYSQTTPHQLRNNGSNYGMLTSSNDEPLKIVVANDHSVAEVIAGLPMAVKVVLNGVSASNLKHYSIGLDGPTGYAWLVVRAYQTREGWIPTQLLTWQTHTLSASSPHPTYLRDGSDCRTLTLPAGAKLLGASSVCIVPLHTRAAAPCGILAVTENGGVCYWPELLKDACITLTIAFESLDDVTKSVISLQPKGIGCVLATEKAQLFQLSTQNAFGRPALGYRAISHASGMLQWGMRSLFGFGASSENVDVVKAINCRSASDGLSELVVVTSSKLSSWKLHSSLPPQLQHEEQILDPTGTPTNATLLQYAQSENFQACVLDANVRSDGTTLLVGLFPTDVAPALYMVGRTQHLGPQTQWTWFPAPIRPVYSRDQDRALKAVKLLMGASDQCIVIVSTVSGNTITVNCGVGDSVESSLCLSEVSIDSMVTDDNAQADTRPLLGVGSVVDDSLVFSDRDGGSMIRILQRNFHSQQEADRDAAEAKNVASHLPSHEQDLVLLRQAFEAFCSSSHDKANNLFKEVRNPDDAVVTFSQSITDSRPEDPRWAETSNRRDENTMSSMILLHQLEAKATQHNKLVEFLSSLTSPDSAHSSLWDSLKNQKTVLNHGEMIAAAIGVRSIHPRPRAGSHEVLLTVQASDKNRQLLDAVIRSTVSHNVNEDRSPNDAFYQTVTMLPGLLSPLLKQEEVELQQSRKWTDTRRILHVTSDVLIALVRQAQTYRGSHAHLYRDNSTATTNGSTRSWTSSDAFRNALRQQHNIIVKFAIKDDSTPPEDLGGMYRRLFELSDGLLSDYASRDELGFVQDREAALVPFVELSCTERTWAYELAEKHHDYTTLVDLCERDGRKKELDQYSLKFGNEFVQAKFQWYVREGKRYKLLDQNDGQQLALGNFLQSHQSLEWLQHIHLSNFNRAHEVLKMLALAKVEPNSVARKRSLLSLGKLALLASDAENEAEMDLLDDELTMLNYQTMIPAESLRDVDQLDVADLVTPLPRDTIIDLLIGNDPRIKSLAVDDCENFVVALKMLSSDLSLTEIDYEERRLVVLAHSIAHDAARWLALPDDEPMEAIAETLLFTTLHEAAVQQVDVSGIDINALCEIATEIATTRGQPSLSTKQFKKHVHQAVEEAAPDLE
eukprot:m.103864 g.103864  ORF g.103864 m.103864 type:complete len:1154 (-) comp27522_c0_seq1:60-3521(-)